MTLSDFLLVVLLALATYRISRLIIFDSLVGTRVDSGTKLSRRIDEWAYNQDGTDKGFWRGKVGDLITCPHCLSFWISWSACSLWWGIRPWAITWQQGLIVWAVAGIASLVWDWRDR